MRSLVIDDEADARARLIRLLGAHPEVAVIGEAQDGLEAIEKIEELRPDLLFLDIEMPGLKGFEVLRSIPSAIEIPLVIFTTGYDQHALAAFEANALAYLLKPIEPERLSVAIERSSKLCSLSAEKEKQRESILRATGEALKAHEIGAHAAIGDASCAATLGRYEERLARALAHVVNLLDPDVIVLGGGMSNVERLYVNVPRLWGPWVFSDRVDTRLVRHQHGDSSGVRGAAWLGAGR